MSTAQSRRSVRRMPHSRRDAKARPRLEPLEDRLVLSLAAGSAVPGELLIGLKSGLAQADIAHFYADHRLSEVKNLDMGDTNVRLVATPTSGAEALIPSLEQDPRIRYAEPNRVQGAAQVPNDPNLGRDWGLVNTGQTGGAADADIDADEAWDVATGGSSLVVAVIDSGVDYTHPDLQANMWRNPGEVPGNKKDDDGNGFVDDYYGYDFANDDGDPRDDNGHGTHVAGTIGMVGNNAEGSAGVNWNVRLMALKYLDENSSGSDADALAAYSYVLMMRSRGVNIRVTNNSYGGGEFSQARKDAIDAMGRAGMLFVAGAGNNAGDNDVGPFYPASYDSPSIISVAATDHNDRYAWFSNWGATSVDLAAPGDFVWSTVPGGYTWYSGTSMATPQVAGAAALVWSAFPDLSAGEVKARLLGGADPIGHIGANASHPTVTNGRLNVRNALIVPPPDHDTTPPAAVADLAVVAASPWSVTLAWTATGDDGTAGRAGYYDVRYASAPITEATWATARPAISEPAPRLAGSSERFTADDLGPGTRYYFAVKVKDNAGNESALSNLAEGNTTAAAYLLDDDVESGPGHWTATDLWHRSSSRAYDSPTAWYFGQEGNRTYFTGTQHGGALTLVSPIDLTGVSQALLRYREWRQVSDFGVPVDVARVQVSRDGANWVTLSEAFTSTFDWERRAVDLTPFVGGPVHLRFDFNTDAGYAPFVIVQGYEGWHIDDVQVMVPGAQPAGFSVDDVTIAEGGDGSVRAIFTVTRSSGSGQASVRYATADGSATVAAGDYVPVSGTLSFLPGQTRQTVTVPVNGDWLGEADEHFVLNLSQPTDGGIADGQGEATIVDDEPRIHVTGGPAFEGNRQAQSIVLFVNLSVPTDQVVTVGYATADGTARAGSDYLPAAGTLTFYPGETRKTIDLTVLKDSEQLPAEAFFVNLFDASANAVILERGVVHIFDLDALHGNHFGYRNRDGGATMLAGPENRGWAAPGIPDAQARKLPGRVPEEQGVTSEAPDAARGQAPRHGFVGTNSAGPAEVVFVMPSTESGPTLWTWYIGPRLNRGRKKW